MVALSAVTGCGAKTAPKPTPSSTRSTPSSPPVGFSATLSAPTHTPKAGANWRYSIRVRGGAGRPLSATANIEFVFGGQVVGRESPPTHHFLGDLHDTVQWPARSVGFPLVFRAVVTTSAGTRTLDYPVRVRP
jgi:hypothetical protein